MLQQLDQDRPPIILYGLLTCPHCRRVKELLEQHSIPFKLWLVDLLVGEERSRVLSEIQSRNREVTFPPLVVGDGVTVGYRPRDIEQVLRESKWIENKKDQGEWRGKETPMNPADSHQSRKETRRYAHGKNSSH